MIKYIYKERFPRTRFLITILAFMLCITAASCTNKLQRYNDMGEEKVKTGEFEEAIKYFDMCIDASPEQYVCHYNKCLALFNLGKPMEAAKECVITNELEKDFVPAYFIRCSANVQTGQYEYAVENCTKLISLSPASWEADYNRALAHEGIGNIEGAIADYSSSIKKNESNFAAYHNRSMLYSAIGNYQAAMNDIDRALELAPQSAITWNENAKN